ANLGLAGRLQEAGVQVVYGVVGFKTHAKMLLVVRREGRRLRRYVHLGTGNYHPANARAYTDLGLMTANTAIGADVHQVFMQLSGLAPAIELGHLLQSPCPPGCCPGSSARPRTRARAGRRASSPR